MNELNYMETIWAAATVARCAQRAPAIRAKIRRGNDAALRRNLGLVIDLADSLRSALPGRVETHPARFDNPPESLSQAMIDCRIRLELVAGYQDELERVQDEAALLALIRRATALAEVIAVDAKTGLDLCSTSDEEAES